MLFLLSMVWLWLLFLLLTNGHFGVYNFKMAKVVDTLKKISPHLKFIKLNKKQTKTYPELVDVLKCHAQSTDCMIRFSKESLVSNCTCEGCKRGLFKHVRMPRPICDNGTEPTCTICIISYRSGQWEMGFGGFNGSRKRGL